MNVGELMAQLAKLPADMPVVVAQEDEPLGIYGVGGVERVRMKRDTFWPHREVWEGGGHYGDGPDPRVEVCYLGTDEPPTQIVDAEVVEQADQVTIACPSGCGGELVVGVSTLPGDSIICTKCQQIHRLTAHDLNIGAGWRELVAKHKAAIEGYDRDTRTLATADQAQADFVSMPAALQGTALRCVVCNQPAETSPCARCQATLNGGRQP